MSSRVRATTLAVTAGMLLGGGLAPPGQALPQPAAADSVAAHYRVAASLQPSTVLVGRAASVTGKVRPQAPGSTVKLQVQVDGAWHTVTTATLNDRSRYTATYLPPAAGTYQLRVRKPAGDGYRRGTSTLLTLTVTPSLPAT